MNTEGSPLLAQLQDIHSAGAPGWWPPAPGWWILALLVLLLMAWMLKQWLAWRSARKRRADWLEALDRINREHDPSEQPHEFLAGLNRLFRAVALRAFPDNGCARLQGEDWVSFIVRQMPDQNEESLLALARGPYESLPRFDAALLNQSARAWVSLYG
jgi:hypothetical protein